jgi:hypothetical protein
MRKTKRRKKTKKSFSLLLSVALVSQLAFADKKTAAAAYAVVVVNVFREPGFALSGAQVSLVPDPEPGQAAVKAKKMQAVCNNRGEAAFRVPPEPMRYLVKAQFKGFHPEEKSVSIQGESERAEVTLELHAESK